VKAEATDQYGYGLFMTVDEWWSDDTSIATVDPVSTMKADVTGESVGTTQYHATIDGLTGNATVKVEDNINDSCTDGQLIC
jgi:hypothetical protein